MNNFNPSIHLGTIKTETKDDVSRLNLPPKKRPRISSGSAAGGDEATSPTPVNSMTTKTTTSTTTSTSTGSATASTVAPAWQNTESLRGYYMSYDGQMFQSKSYTMVRTDN